MNDNTERDLRLHAIPDIHGHAKGEHKAYVEERPLPLTARMLFLWFYHACRRGYPRFLMVADHMNYLTFEDPAAVNLVRRALKLAQAGDLYGAAETANVEVGHAAVVSEGLRKGMRYSIGAEIDNDPRSRPDAQNIVDAMRPDGMIRSVHFIPITHPVHGENWNWPFDNPEFKEFYDIVSTEQLWESYITILVDAIERLPGHVVGHFFVPAIFGHWPPDEKLSEYEDRVLAAAAARGMAVEFNTRFLYREHTDEEKQRYLEANKRFLRKAKERGVGIAIGSDAHSPKDQGGAFETVLQVLDELDINELVFPLGGQLRRVALRVVREPEPEPAPEPVRSSSPERQLVESELIDGAGEAPVEQPAAALEPVPTAPPKPRRTRPAPKPKPSPDGAEAEVMPVEAHPSGNGVVPEEQAPSEAPPEVTVHAEPQPQAEPEAHVEPEPEPERQPEPVSEPHPEPVAAAKTRARKSAPAKAGAAKKAAPPAKAPAAKAPAAKAPAAKKTAAAKPKKATPARAAVKKAGPPKKTAKKSAAKKATPPRRPAKKAAPKKGAPKKAAPKKAAGKKSAPARSAPARKSTSAKKTTKKATKRR